MKLVLLSGGSGKRLWPMSNDVRSKQFLRVLKGEQGQPLSMLQRVCGQLAKTHLLGSTYICASKSQSDIIHAQVGDVRLIQEPARRDTFAAVALSCLYLSDIAGCQDDEVMVVAPVDHFVDDSYFTRIRKLAEEHAKSNAQLTLLGVRATEASTKFGYITRFQNTDTTARVQRVRDFVEKPDRHRAEQLVLEGALWNCGVFCFRIGWLKDVLRQKHLPSTYGALEAGFQSLPNRSFDYEVVEHVDSINVLSYEGTWKDLGTWSALTEEIEMTFVGLGEGMNCHNTHVINELGIPAIAIGCQDLIVVATPDGILVANKHDSQKLKEIASAYGERPMYQERGWGTYRVLDYQALDGDIEVLTQSIELIPGKNISYHKHASRREVWTIVEGEGEIALDGHIRSVSPGDVISVATGQWHAIRANTKLQFIEIQQGSELVDTDIERACVDWADVLDLCSDKIPQR